MENLVPNLGAIQYPVVLTRELERVGENQERKNTYVGSGFLYFYQSGVFCFGAGGGI